MNTTFKKTLVAVALSAAAMSAQAVTVTVPAASILSFEGAANETTIALPSVRATVGTGVEYAAGDIITVTVAGGSITAASTPTLTFTPSVAEAGDSVSLTFLSKDASTITFRVAQVTNAGGTTAITSAGRFDLTGVNLTTASVLATTTNKVSVTYAAKTALSNLTIDGADTSGSDKANAITVLEEFKGSASRKLNAVIDVANDRKLFTAITDAPATPADSTTKDTLTLAFTDDATVDAATDATLASIALKIAGDFTWMDADKNGAVSTAELNAAFAYAGTDDTVAQPTINTAMNEISGVVTLVGALDAAHSFTFTVPGLGATKPVLNSQDYTVTATASYTPQTGTATTKALLSAASAGSWTLNGSTVVVPYLVHQYGKFSSILNVQNSGNKEGAISIDVWAEDGTVVATNLAAGTSKPGTVTSVATAAVNALIAKGYDLSKTTKYSVRVVTNVPAKDVTVNSAYADVSGATVTRTPVANDSAVQNKGDL